mmetsp:Transcript_62617/g.147266  ORF Transcript_62617/g.147266 Transcript_62617/m.147266 type:complete len:354 (+) Transcript_62617:753-1814(+)
MARCSFCLSPAFRLDSRREQRSAHPPARVAAVRADERAAPQGRRSWRSIRARPSSPNDDASFRSTPDKDPHLVARRHQRRAVCNIPRSDDVETAVSRPEHGAAHRRGRGVPDHLDADGGLCDRDAVGAEHRAPRRVSGDDVPVARAVREQDVRVGADVGRRKLGERVEEDHGLGEGRAVPLQRAVPLPAPLVARGRLLAHRVSGGPLPALRVRRAGHGHVSVRNPLRDRVGLRQRRALARLQERAVQPVGGVHGPEQAARDLGDDARQAPGAPRRHRHHAQLPVHAPAQGPLPRAGGPQAAHAVRSQLPRLLAPRRLRRGERRAPRARHSLAALEAHHDPRPQQPLALEPALT